MAPPWIAVVGAVCVAVIAGIGVGRAEGKVTILLCAVADLLPTPNNLKICVKCKTHPVSNVEQPSLCPKALGEGRYRNRSGNSGRAEHCSLCVFIIRLSVVCGWPALNTRIVGGQVASKGSWPWQVSLQRFGFHFCGGSLINKEWVLTAAHCFESTSTSGLAVLLGLQSQEGYNPNEVSRTVSQIINHPSYNPSTFDNDISLLKLSSPVTFNNFILPVCLAASDSTFNDGMDTWITGWGNIGYG
eukprot:superscaffoldBa00007470_g22569